MRQQQKQLDKFRIQLHQYAITQVWKNKTFKNQIILELECGNAAGLSYIAEAYGPQICIGIDASNIQIQNNLKVYNYQSNLKFKNIYPNELRSMYLPNKADVIIGIELNKKPALKNINIKSYLEKSMNLLKEQGYLIISEFDTIQNLFQLEEILNIDGLRLIEKQDFTIGLVSALQLQIANIKKHEKIQGNWISKFIYKKLNPYEQKLQQLRDRQKLYMVYVLRKDKL